MRVKRHRRNDANKMADPERGSAVSISTSNGIRKPSKFLLLVAILLALVVTGYLLDVPTRILNLLARKSVADLDYAKAQVWLKRTSLFNRDNAQSEMIAARVSRHLGMLDEMSEHLSRASRLGANELDVKMEEAMALAQTGKLDRVEADLFQWLSNGLGDADEISDAYANGLAANSRFDNANEILAAWRRDFPNDPRPDYRLGRIKEHFQVWDEAIAAYLASLQRRDDYYPSRYRLGRVYFVIRKIDEAKKAFENCLLMPLPEAAKIQLALCYRSLGEGENARKILQQVLQQDYGTIVRSYQSVEEAPEHFEAAATLGDLESEAGNYQEAYKWLKLAVDKNPRDLTARYSLALTLRRLGQVEQSDNMIAEVQKARTALERANPLRDRIAAKPDDLEARLELGKLLLENESMRMGRFWLQSIFKFDPNYREAHRALADHYRQLAESSPEYRPMAEFHAKAAGLPNP
jgi:tetratricopeptide (TPR) repeat protein